MTSSSPSRRACAVALCGLVAACGASFAPGGTFVEVVAWAPASDCPSGGATLRVGDDRNVDGRLDDAEVRAISIVCSGSKEHPVEVDVAPFDADERCGAGGVEVAIEADANGDGDVEDAERRVRVLCHGDGGLLPGDVIKVASFAVVDDAQVQQYLAGVRRFEGDLAVYPLSGAASLSTLERVSGSLHVRAPAQGGGEPAAASLSLPKLARLDGDLLLTNLQSLGSVSLPALSTVGGALTVASVSYLEELSLPKLERVGRQVRLASTGLVRASLPALTSAASVSVELNERLIALDLPLLEDASTLVVRRNPRLGDCTAFALARSLEAIGFDGDVVVEGNGGVGQCPNTSDDCVSEQVEGLPVLYCRHRRNHLDAAADCASLGGRLFEPRTEASSSAFHEARPSDFPSEVWIGLSDSGTEGDFVWTDGTPLGGEWTGWATGEPSNSGGVEDCVQLRGDGTWNDRDCADVLAVACVLSE